MANNGVVYSNFQISPPKRPVRNRGRDDESARPQYLTLGAFTSTPKLHFEKVQIGQSRCRTLIVQNTSDYDIMFRFLKMPSPVFELSCPDANMITAKGHLNILIKWTPTEVGRCFEALQCQSDLCGVRLTVHLLGEAEPAPFRTKSSSTGSGRRMFRSVSSKQESCVQNVPRVQEKLPVHLQDPSLMSTSPSRRETYLVPPTPVKTPRRKFSAAISGLTLELEDDQDDEFKENDPAAAIDYLDLNFYGKDNSGTQALNVTNPVEFESEYKLDDTNKCSNDCRGIGKEANCHVLNMMDLFGDSTDLEDELLEKGMQQISEGLEFLMGNRALKI